MESTRLETLEQQVTRVSEASWLPLQSQRRGHMKHAPNSKNPTECVRAGNKAARAIGAATCRTHWLSRGCDEAHAIRADAEYVALTQEG